VGAHETLKGKSIEERRNAFAHLYMESSLGLKGVKEKLAGLGKVEKSMAPVSLIQARQLGKKIGVNFGKVSLHEFWMGCNVELEHKKVFKHDDNFLTAAKISADHLKEKKNYYTLLKKVEKGLGTPEAHDYVRQPMMSGKAAPGAEPFSYKSEAQVYVDRLNKKNAAHNAQIVPHPTIKGQHAVKYFPQKPKP
jgi:hypothetical protein